METRGLIQSAPKLYAAFPPPHLIKIGQLALEIFKFEGVDKTGGRRTDEGPLVYYKLTLWPFSSPYEPSAQVS